MEVKNQTIKVDNYGDFTYLSSSKNLHRFNTNGILKFECIAIRNLDGELTLESAKHSLETYLTKFGKGVKRK